MSCVQLELDFRAEHLRKDTDKLIRSFEPMIHNIVRKKIFDSDCSDVCMDYDDVIQYGRQLVWEAALDYKSNRGAKLSTYVHLKLETKMSNLGKKIRTRKTKGGMMNFTNLHSEDEQDSDLPHIVERQLIGFSDKDILIRDQIEKLIRDLKPTEQRILRDHFLKGYSIKEVVKRTPHCKVDILKKRADKIKNILSQRYNDT